MKREYNTDGDEIKMIDGTGTTTDHYDQLDRLTESADGHGATTSYEYDLADNQTKIVYPNGKAVTRAFDNDERLASVTDWAEHTTKFAYDPDSDQSATTFPSATGAQDTYAYDNADNMGEVKMAKGSETLASLVYTSNRDGEVTKATTVGLPGEAAPVFSYDENSRLLKGAGVKYGYDAANNLTTLEKETLSYNAADQLEQSVYKKAATATYAYDENGRRTKLTPAKGPATSYGYDQAGDLTTVTRAAGEAPAIEDSYAYDGDGLRASQTISGTTSYLSWDTAVELPLILDDGTSSYIYGPGGVPIEQINNTTGTVTYLHHDQAGSTRLLTGSTGTVTGKCTYGAYGAPTCEGASTTPLGYDGQYTSSDTGLVYLRNRVYDPATAQFLTGDPLEMVTRAPYTYGEDNPLNRGDATGLSSWNPFSESFWTEGNFISESPLNPIPYYEAEVESYESGCGYFASVTHGLEGAVAGTALFAGGEGEDEADSAVADITFGHGARHLIGTGLDSGEVESAIQSQIEQSAAKASATGSFWGRTVVDGQTVEYRAYTLPKGTINVGTYYVSP